VVALWPTLTATANSSSSQVATSAGAGNSTSSPVATSADAGNSTGSLVAIATADGDRSEQQQEPRVYQGRTGTEGGQGSGSPATGVPQGDGPWATPGRGGELP